jgi:hypothetical protein
MKKILILFLCLFIFALPLDAGKQKTKAKITQKNTARKAVHNKDIIKQKNTARKITPIKKFNIEQRNTARKSVRIKSHTKRIEKQ